MKRLQRGFMESHRLVPVIKDGYSSSGLRTGFFSSVRTWASFISSGNTSVDRERFTSQAMGAARTSASFLPRPVGIRSRADDFTGQNLSKPTISSVVTSLKAMKLTFGRAAADLGTQWSAYWKLSSCVCRRSFWWRTAKIFPQAKEQSRAKSVAIYSKEDGGSWWGLRRQ